MNKKTMMTITAVLSIVFGALMVLLALFSFMCYNMATVDFVEEILIESGEVYTQAELDSVATMVRSMFMGMGVALILFAIVDIILGSFLISKANKRQNATGLLIALIVISALSGNIITLIFAILAMCAKYPQEIQTLDDLDKRINPEIVLEDLNKTDDK